MSFFSFTIALVVVIWFQRLENAEKEVARLRRLERERNGR